MKNNKIYKDINKQLAKDKELNKKKKEYLVELESYINQKIDLEEAVVKTNKIKKKIEKMDIEKLINDLPVDSLVDSINIDNGKPLKETLSLLVDQSSMSRKEIDEITKKLEKKLSDLRLLKIDHIMKTIDKILEVTK